MEVETACGVRRVFPEEKRVYRAGLCWLGCVHAEQRARSLLRQPVTRGRPLPPAAGLVSFRAFPAGFPRFGRKRARMGSGSDAIFGQSALWINGDTCSHPHGLKMMPDFLLSKFKSRETK